jgi:uncharacterized protein (DUF488 family)
MPEAKYNQVMAEIKTLNLSDQLRLLEEMATLIRKKTSQAKPRSILELKGNSSLCDVGSAEAQ